jgi:hypothetical protein
MRTWLKFLLLPWIALILLGLIETFVMAGILHKVPRSGYGVASALLVGLLIGQCLYALAPRPKALTSCAYAVLMAGLSFYAGMATDGTPMAFGDGRFVHDFSFLA